MGDAAARGPPQAAQPAFANAQQSLAGNSIQCAPAARGAGVGDLQRIGAQWFIAPGAFAPSGRLTIVEPHTGRSWSLSQADARARRAADLPLP